MKLQGTAAWFDDRVGKLTASKMPLITKKLKSGNYSSERYQIIQEIIEERKTGVPWKHFVTPAMQYGIDYEDEARDAYALIKNVSVIQTGFIDHQYIEFFGASPDGIAGGKLIEIKCPTEKTFDELEIFGNYERWLPQIYAQLSVMKMQELDLVVYRHDRKAPLIFEIKATQGDILHIEHEAESALDLIDKLFWESF